MIYTLEDLKKMRKSALVDAAKSIGIDVAVRWGKVDLIQKIREKQKLDELHNETGADVQPENSVTESEKVIKPDFEILTASGSDIADKPPLNEVPENKSEPVDNRGGFREGAGRPVGMTNLESNIRRLLELETPDVIILKVIGALSIFYGLKTGKPFTEDEIKTMSLGVTRELYYFFPGLQGKTSVLTFHIQSLSEISGPVAARVTENLLMKKTESEKKENGEQQGSGN